MSFLRLATAPPENQGRFSKAGSLNPFYPKADVNADRGRDRPPEDSHPAAVELEAVPSPRVAPERRVPLKAFISGAIGGEAGAEFVAHAGLRMIFIRRLRHRIAQTWDGAARQLGQGGRQR